MATAKAKKVKAMDNTAIMKRITKILVARAKYEADIDNVHVKLMKGNTKTGKDVWTVSLAPIIDCQHCSECKDKCYDIRNDCIYPSVIESRAKNSALHRLNRIRYWLEIEEQIKELGVKFLRVNVGGDVDYDDMCHIARIAEDNTGCRILFFTKNYEDGNLYLDKHDGRLPKNMHMIYSRWENMECKNPYNIPESHVLWADGNTTAPVYGAYFCQGNCGNCFLGDEGCPNLKRGEHVVFNAH